MEGWEVEVPVTVYPGVFPAEYQVTLNLSGHDISANVSAKFVRLEGEVNERGAKGYLTVRILDRRDKEVIVGVPGEVFGAPSQVRLPAKALEVA